MGHDWRDRWQRGRELGRGGQGVTYFVNSIENPTLTGVIKFLRNAKSVSARRRMRREVVNLETLSRDHSSVPRIIDHNTDFYDDFGVNLYAVMEYVEGPTLREYVGKEGVLDTNSAIRFTLSLCNTVKAAHSNEILHRDLKPENIIVRSVSDADLVVVDYGLSFNRVIDEITEADETFRNRFLDLPETNTPGGNRRDHRSDLTSICAILYYCLTGASPGQLTDSNGLAPHKRRGFMLSNQQEDGRVAEIEKLFTRGFALNIANRFQTIDEVINALDNLKSADQEFDESDPIRVARSISRLMRAHDRTTQLAEFREQAKNLLGFIQKEAENYSSKLLPFQVQNVMGGMGFGGNNSLRNSLPGGLDFVDESQFMVVLSIAHHPIQKRRKYVVASRGEQCVLLCNESTAIFDQFTPVVDDKTEWKEIAWYEGDSVSIFDLVADSYEKWLVQKMREISNHVLPT